MLAFVTFCLPALAQDQSWLQVEAQPDLATATERAQAYSSLFPTWKAFRPRGWYAVLIGPFSRDEAGQQLLKLRGEGMIPRDSFIADGATFGQRFWPAGADPATATLPDATLPTVDPAPETATETATETAAPAPEPAAEPAPEPAETLAQAREAEQALSKR